MADRGSQRKECRAHFGIVRGDCDRGNGVPIDRIRIQLNGRKGGTEQIGLALHNGGDLWPPHR